MNKKGFAQILIVMAIGIIVVGAFIFLRQTKIVPQTIAWVSYEDPVTKFSLQYPSDWVKIGAPPLEDNPNRKFDYQYVYLIFAGKEGIITIDRTSALGGGCADYQPIQIGIFKTTACHSEEKGKEDWSQIYLRSPSLNNEAFSMVASVYQPTEENRGIILKILSSVSGVSDYRVEKQK